MQDKDEHHRVSSLVAGVLQWQTLPTSHAAFVETNHGRAHKRLVHCAAVGHPIVGDPSSYDIYGEASPNNTGISEVYIMDALSPHTRASLELQRQLNTALLPVFSTMCLHAKELSLKHHPVT